MYFITGATGAIGSAVAARLLDEPGVRIVALVRGDSPAGAADRLSAALVPLGVSRQAIAQGGRVQVALGDAQQPRFGLSSDEHAALESACTHVIHCAGAVRMNLAIELARRAAVDSSRNAIHLARRIAEVNRLVKAEMVSTVGVGGRAHRRLTEDWVGTAHAFHNSYEQAKAEAEVEMRTAIEEGLPLTVHRPSMVVGDSRTGRAMHFQVFYFLAEFLSGRRTGGLFPRLGDAQLDIVPADFVAEAIVRSSRSEATAGRILHLCGGPQAAIPLSRLQAIVRDRLAARGEKLPRVRYVSRALFRRLAQALQWVVDERTGAALATLPVFLDYLDTEQTFDNRRTREWLESEQVAIPAPDAYLARILDFYFSTKDRGRLKASSA